MAAPVLEARSVKSLIQTPELLASGELVEYEHAMNLCLGVAKNCLEKGDRALACLVKKDYLWVRWRGDSTITDNDPHSHYIIKTLDSAAEYLGDSALTGCTIITPYKPDMIGQIAIRMRPGIRRVIWGSPTNPYTSGTDGPDIISSTLYGKPPQIIEGLHQSEAEEFYKTHPVNYNFRTATNYADALHALNAQHGSMEHRIISDLLGDNLAGQAVLDAGCGIGDEVALLHSKGAKVYGIDTSPEFVRLARQTHPDLSDLFLEARTENLPFPDASFDIILCKYVLNEVDKDRIEGIYREFHRCLKPDGKLLLFIHDPASQMFSADSETGEVLLDLFRQGKVNVRVFNNVVVLEPRHTYADYLAPLVRNFRLTYFDQGQDEQRIHPDKNIPEMLVLMAEKLENR